MLEQQDDLQRILNALLRLRKSNISFYPKIKDVMRPFRETPLHRVRVVVVGKEPYAGFDNEVCAQFAARPDGLLILTAALTVQHDKAVSHLDCWKGFMANCIKACSARGSVTFYLLDDDAQYYNKFIDTKTNTLFTHF